ncbi:MAG: NAD(P)-dependent oxidoreductase [Bacteroidetes bacterium]|nr:NAD(P)-dependent oxidoreductase [Bacteroidota bacterium]
MSAPVIVITGANGFIGSAAAAYFAALGWQVVTAGRTPHRSGYAHLAFNLESERPLQADLPQNTDVVLHAAYLTLTQNNRAYELNRAGTQALLHAAAQCGATQFIFLSSLSAKAGAVSVYGRQKFACEKMVLAQNGCVVRPGLVIGNGGLFAQMHTHLAAGRRIPLFNGGQQPLQTVYINDLLEALHIIITQQRKGAYTIATPQSIPYRQFFEIMARHLDKPARFLHFPLAPVKLMLRIARKLGIRLAAGDDNLAGLQSMQHVASESDLHTLGLTLKTAEESIAALQS